MLAQLYPVCLAALTGIALSLMATGARAEQDYQATKAELSEVRERIERIKSRLERDRERRSDLSEAVESVERRIAEVGERLHELDREIGALRREIERLRQTKAEQRAALSEQLDALAEQVRVAYRNGKTSKLRLLLSQDDPATLGRLITYHEHFSRARAREIRDLRADFEALRETERKLASRMNRLAERRERRGEVLARLEASRAERERALESLEERLANSGRKLATLKEDEAALNELLDSLRESLADIPARGKQKFASLKGDLPRPVSGRPLARYGAPKAGGKLRWQGLWLAAEEGAPVQAVAAGRVVYVGWMHRYGQIVVLDHGDGYYTVYGHNQAIYVETGQWVDAGATIAGAGSSGGHRTSGVYFEIRKGRRSIDPDGWLRS